MTTGSTKSVPDHDAQTNQLAFLATVYVVDDDAAVLKSIARLLRSAGFRVEAFNSPSEFLQNHDPQKTGCLVLDIAMPDFDGLELQQALVENSVMTPIVFLTGHGDIPMTVQAMKSGASDFLTKPVSDDVLLRAVRQAIEKDHLARQMRAEVDSIRMRLTRLTPREREVLTHVIAGKLNKQTAFDLGTAEKTIKVHRRRIMEKMQVQSLAELVRVIERVKIDPTEA